MVTCEPLSLCNYFMSRLNGLPWFWLFYVIFLFMVLDPKKMEFFSHLLVFFSPWPFISLNYFTSPSLFSWFVLTFFISSLFYLDKHFFKCLFLKRLKEYNSRSSCVLKSFVQQYGLYVHSCFKMRSVDFNITCEVF